METQNAYLAYKYIDREEYFFIKCKDIDYTDEEFDEMLILNGINPKEVCMFDRLTDYEISDFKYNVPIYDYFPLDK